LVIVSSGGCLAEFQSVGSALATAGLIHGSSGNLSLRLEGRILITTHGSDLARLTASDVVEVGLNAGGGNSLRTSSELPVHRAIYQVTGARAVVHAHPAHAVTLSSADKAPDVLNAPVVGEGAEIVPGALAEEVARALKSFPLVMVRGHGSFAIGNTMEEALQLTLAFEKKCRALREKRGPVPSSNPSGL
jgi:L-fuculose-phosphate aldolase